MSIVNWDLKEGDVIEVYYRTADTYKIHKVLKVLDGYDFFGPLTVIVENGHIMGFDEDDQQWKYLGD